MNKDQAREYITKKIKSNIPYRHATSINALLLNLNLDINNQAYREVAYYMCVVNRKHIEELEHKKKRHAGYVDIIDIPPSQHNKHINIYNSEVNARLWLKNGKIGIRMGKKTTLIKNKHQLYVRIIITNKQPNQKTRRRKRPNKRKNIKRPKNTPNIQRSV